MVQKWCKGCISCPSWVAVSHFGSMMSGHAGPMFMSELSNEYGGIGCVCELGWIAERAAMAANDFDCAVVKMGIAWKYFNSLDIFRLFYKY